VEVKIADDGEEILAREANNIMVGYYKLPGKTT
jgi:long-subunit acyl-CoA synthetase (AMP-forming)